MSGAMSILGVIMSVYRPPNPAPFQVFPSSRLIRTVLYLMAQYMPFLRALAPVLKKESTTTAPRCHKQHEKTVNESG